MSNPLIARLDKLETKLPPPKRPGRVISIVAGEHDREAAMALARENGFDPDDENSSDLLILHSIVSPAGQGAVFAGKERMLTARGCAPAVLRSIQVNLRNGRVIASRHAKRGGSIHVP